MKTMTPEELLKPRLASGKLCPKALVRTLEGCLEVKSLGDLLGQGFTVGWNQPHAWPSAAPGAKEWLPKHMVSGWNPASVLSGCLAWLDE